MGLFIFRFWPVLIPLVLYAVWHRRALAKAKKDNKPLPHFRDGPWYWAVLASMVIGIFCFAYLAATETQGTKGEYTPPRVEDGKIVPGHVSP